MDVTNIRSLHHIKIGDIILTYTGILCMGKMYYEAVYEMDDVKTYDQNCQTAYYVIRKKLCIVAYFR